MVATVSNGSAVAMLVVCAFVSASVGVMVACALSRRSRRRRVFETALRLDLVDDSTDPDQLLASIERSLRDARVDALEEREHTARLQLAIDSMAEAVLVYDTDGVMLEHNASAAQYIDARHGDALVGAAIGDLVRVSLSGEAASTTLELFGPPRRWVVLTTTPVATDSGPVVVAMVEDITERRLLEAMRTDFVANISHELKTPVGAIALLAETLEVENDSVVAERLAGRIHVEALRVGRTIEDLLELSRIESATAHPDRRVDLCEIIGEAVTRLRPAAEHASDEFAHSIGLGDVVIGTDLETHDGVDLGTLRGDHDDGHVRLRADLPAHVDARDLRQHDVEEDQVGIEIGVQRQRFGAITGDLDLEPFPGEPDRQRLDERILVLDHQY